MRRSYNFIYPLFFAIVVAFGMVVGTKMIGSDTFGRQKQSIPSDKKLDKVISYIKASYVDSVNDQNLVESAINGMLKKLDPHSTYIPAERRKRMKSELKGNFEGIGIEFNILRDTIVVVSPIVGGPSEKLGIQSGDKIIKVEGENVAGTGITNQKVVDMLRGEKGTKVDVTIKRDGLEEPLHFTIKRDKIPIHSVRASYLVEDDIGYIKINRFSGNTMKEFGNAINNLKAQGLNNLILDLRGNPGGYLKAAIRLADEFLPSDDMIVYTKGRARPKQVHKATNRGRFEEGKLVILINEGSASASEIVSGAVQDQDRGLIIGRRSFGKGLVQEPKLLEDGSAIRLTVARYYTPTGRSIQKPYKEKGNDYRKDLYNRYQHGELTHKDSIDFADSLKYETSNGRTVYGGGGIMPDFFVPIDTTLSQSDYFTKIRRKGLINRFALDFVDEYRGEIKENYPTRKAFINDFRGEGVVFNRFIQFMEENDLNYNREKVQPIKGEIVARIKGLIGRQFWENDIYFQVINKTNESYLKAIEAIKGDAFQKRNLN